MAHRAIRKETVRKPRLAASNSCGKVAYTDRKQARHARKGLRGERLRAYRCHKCGLFHIGHQPYMVRRGLISADDYYGNGRAA